MERGHHLRLKLRSNNNGFKLSNPLDYFVQRSHKIKNVCRGIIINCPGNYKLIENIFSNGSEVGIIINSDNVRLDLRNFNIASTNNSKIGILLVDGISKIEIRNGYIEGFSDLGISGNVKLSNILIRDITLINNGFTSTPLGFVGSISLGNDNVESNNINITNCHIQDSNANIVNRGSAGVGIFTCSNASITGCSIINSSNLFSGFFIGATSVAKIEDCVVSNNTNISGGVTMFIFRPGGSTIATSVNNNVVSNNSFARGVCITGGTTTITNNRIIGNTGDIIALINPFFGSATVNNNIMSNNVSIEIEDPDIVSRFSGIDFSGFNTSFEAKDNIFTNNRSNFSMFAVSLSAEPRSTISDNILVLDKMISTDNVSDLNYSLIGITKFFVADPDVIMRAITRDSNSSNNHGNNSSISYNSAHMINSLFQNNLSIGEVTGYRYGNGASFVTFDSNKSNYDSVVGFESTGEPSGTFIRNIAIQNQINYAQIPFNTGSPVQNISIPPLVPAN